MRWATFLFAVVMFAVACSGSSYPTRPTYEASDGRVYFVTDCPEARSLVIGGIDAADALPEKGNTDRDHVEDALVDARESVSESSGVVAVNVIQRDGEVWFRTEGGGYDVEQVDDYQLEYVLGADRPCPPNPFVHLGVPVLFNHQH